MKNVLLIDNELYIIFFTMAKSSYFCKYINRFLQEIFSINSRLIHNRKFEYAIEKQILHEILE